jgi:hypothetical protein
MGVVLQRLARIVNVSDCTPNEFFNCFSLDDTQAPDIVSDNLRLRDINTHLMSIQACRDARCNGTLFLSGARNSLTTSVN